MKISHLTTLGFVAMMAVTAPATAEVDGSIYIINKTSSPMCAIYFTTPEADFADSPELLLANDLECIAPGEEASIWYEGLSDCYAVVEIFDEVADRIYGNGFELCTRQFIEITDDDLSADEGTDEPVPEVVVEEGGEHIGHLEIINTSDQQLCLVYFESLYNEGEMEAYQIGEDGSCIGPDMVYFLEYDLEIAECEVQLAVETGFLDVPYNQVYNLCERTKVLVSD